MPDGQRQYNIPSSYRWVIKSLEFKPFPHNPGFLLLMDKKLTVTLQGKGEMRVTTWCMYRAPIPYKPTITIPVCMPHAQMSVLSMIITDLFRKFWMYYYTSPIFFVVVTCNAASATCNKISLTLSQTTNFRLFQTKRVCRRQF